MEIVVSVGFQFSEGLFRLLWILITEKFIVLKIETYGVSPYIAFLSDIIGGQSWLDRHLRR